MNTLDHVTVFQLASRGHGAKGSHTSTRPLVFEVHGLIGK